MIDDLQQCQGNCGRQVDTPDSLCHICRLRLAHIMCAEAAYVPGESEDEIEMARRMV